MVGVLLVVALFGPAADGDALEMVVPFTSDDAGHREQDAQAMITVGVGWMLGGVISAPLAVGSGLLSVAGGVLGVVVFFATSNGTVFLPGLLAVGGGVVVSVLVASLLVGAAGAMALVGYLVQARGRAMWRDARAARGAHGR